MVSVLIGAVCSIFGTCLNVWKHIVFVLNLYGTSSVIKHFAFHPGRHGPSDGWGEKKLTLKCRIGSTMEGLKEGFYTTICPCCK